MPAKTRVFLDMMEEMCCEEARKRLRAERAGAQPVAASTP
jgi:hypothetical protein